MPTGYTEILCKREQEFSEFALGCARAFGACVRQRDDPISDIPKFQKVSSYHEEKLESANKELERLLGMDHKAQIAYGKKERNLEIQRCQLPHD